MCECTVEVLVWLSERGVRVCVLSVACTVAERARVCVSIDRHAQRGACAPVCWRVCVCGRVVVFECAHGRWRVRARRGVAVAAVDACACALFCLVA